MAQKILLLLFSLSFSGGLVIILIFSTISLFRKKISRQWQYYIWIAAIARLLLPFAPSESLSFNAANNFSTMSHPAGADITTPSADASSRMTDPSQHQNGLGIISRLTIPLLKIAWAGKKYLCILWLLIAALLFLRKITIYQDFVRFIRAGSMPIDDINHLEALSKLEAQLSIHKALDLWECELIPSPMLIGFLHPCIVLPKSMRSEKQLHYTLLHELMHYKRRDMYYKWATQFTLSIHWFNPLAYLMGRTINRLCELSCDEAVTSHLTDHQCREYAATLLDAMAASGSYKEPLASITLNGNKQLLKERIESIMNQKEKTTKSSKLLPALLTVAVAATSFFSGSYLVDATEQMSNAGSYSSASPTQSTQPAGITTNNTLASLRKKDRKITSSQADEMALALTNKTWVWDWISFFVPYMSKEGVKQLLPASKKSEWAGYTDMTTGKKLKFTKKQIKAARKNKPSQALTCKDIDSHALLIMQSNGDWDCISFMLPYMSHKGIRAVVRCFNEKHGGEAKRASDYY